MYNKSQKAIESLSKKYALDSEDIEKLCTLSKSRNRWLRSNVAILLGRVSNEKAERTLYSLSFDKNEYVRIEAVDSLAVGKNVLSEQRLRKICSNGNSYLRFYGIQSYCDVYLNIYGFNQCKEGELLTFLQELEEREKDQFVLAAIYKCKVICGDERAVYKLIQMHITATEVADNHLITPIFNLLSELEDCVVNGTNSKAIDDYMRTLERSDDGNSRYQ